MLNRLRIIRYYLFNILRLKSKSSNLPIYDIDLTNSLSKIHKKRVLLSYIVDAINITDKSNYHNAIIICRNIIQSFNELGYLVDLVDFRDQFFKPRREYEIFVGHGMVNYINIINGLNTDCRKFYYATGSYWKFHNEEEEKRFNDFYKRTGIKAEVDRYFHTGEELALMNSETVILMGNKQTLKTYDKFKNVKLINGIVSDDSYDHYNTDWKQRKNNFLYFAGYGNIHKGLDLLIEAFSKTNLNLWIVSNLDDSILKAYKDILDSSLNIRVIGFVNYRTEEFYKIMNNCAFVILPSCSEGSALSVSECMIYGLLPVITNTCGMDIDDFGYYILPSIEDIRLKILELSEFNESELKTRSQKASEYVIDNLNEENFRNNFKNIILHKHIEPV
ncbi:MAG: glycosyltransferase [Ignavibacteria bacterium]|nr:glycosyltransferase [Ignavibacteria bacterium]